METAQLNSARLRFMQSGKMIHVTPGSIIRLEAKSNYTCVYFNNHPPVLMAKVLRIYDQILRPYGFVRTHRSHLVNPEYVSALDRQGLIHMQDHSLVEVSRRKKRDVLSSFNKKIS